MRNVAVQCNHVFKFPSVCAGSSALR